MREFTAPYPGAPNVTVVGDGFLVSYNHDTGQSPNTALFTAIGNLMGASLHDGEETALVKGDNYYILTGDWREEYLPLVDQGFDACYAFYEKMAPEFKNNWSTDSK